MTSSTSHFENNDISLPETPTAPKPSFQVMTHDDAVDPLIPIHPSDSPFTPDNPSTSLQLPIPTLPIAPSQAPLVLSDLVEQGKVADPLLPELANADISVAPDGSFVETSSAPAARELKRYWDQKIGVGKEIRSPYAITAFVNQHGKQMFRIGPRELSAPAAQAAEIEERITQASSPSTPSEPSTSPRSKRRSRMSMHVIPSIFKNGSSSSSGRFQATQSSQGPRKLRKTRSNSDMAGSTNGISDATALGRVHSRSVTGADVSPFSVVVQSPESVDLFGQVMHWPLPTSLPNVAADSAVQASDDAQESRKSSAILSPFGPGVSYDSPSHKNNTPVTAFYLPLPRHLREVQSFESGLTARQFDQPGFSGNGSNHGADVYHDDRDAYRPSSIYVHPSTPPSDRASDNTPTSATPEPTSMSPQLLEQVEEPYILSRYSADVFDVLQTYRGLPLLEKLSPESEETETTVIKLSLSADDSASPKNDPRFVIWGEVQLDKDHDDTSSLHESLTEFSVQSSSLSRRRASKARVPLTTSTTHSSSGDTQKVLIAATIERWIAQLTSDLNYDELLDFFLTYRTYVSAVDLCHLLIARFHWALRQSTSVKDEHVKRVVRVRTFVAIRYWLLTFFTVDFLPNRELRLLVAYWLNTLVRDPILKNHKDGLGIIRKLINVTKECKQAHMQSPRSTKPSQSIDIKSPQPEKAHVLGEHFAAATRKSDVQDDDSDVDLDFAYDEEAAMGSPQTYARDIANAHLSVAYSSPGSSPIRPSSLPFSSFSILQRTELAPGPGEDGEPTSFVQTSATLPVHHSAISRALVRTFGRLGRWKRVLNSRSVARSSIAACADVSAFDVESIASRDLLTVNGGVERYLKAVGSPDPSIGTTVQVQVPPSPVVPSMHPSSSALVDIDDVLPDGSKPTVHEVSLNQPSDTVESEVEPPYDPEIEAEPQHPPGIPLPHESATKKNSLESITPEVVQNTLTAGDQRSVRSSTSTDSFGEPLTNAPTFPSLGHHHYQFFDVVSIDDLDLSDESSAQGNAGPSAPSGSRRPPRKLPLRRDFEFVRRSDTVSSMGLTSRDSVTSYSSSHASGSAPGLGGNVAQWQLNALLDSLSDDEETGDRENALKTLEGQINPQKQQEKANKVDVWIRSIQERMIAGDYDDDSDEDQDEALQEHESSDYDSVSIHKPPPISDSERASEGPGEEGLDIVHTPVPAQVAHVVPVPSGPGSPTRSPDSKPAVEDVVPFEILQSRMPSRPSTSSGTSNRMSFSRFATGSSEAPRTHRSFILNHRTTELAEHFAMIDRELFMGVKFEELVLDDWMNCKEVDVLDWPQYLKDRARWKAEKRYPERTSALGAVRARFNLMANFVMSEIVLTQPQERPVLVSKFIRVAWKAYMMCNFSTLVAIINGLASGWVTTAMKRNGWSRVGLWENRMLKDLKVFTSHMDDFKYIRQTIASIADLKPLDGSSHTSAASGAGADIQASRGKPLAERPVVPSACIPFIGVYLSQLLRHSRLPDLIDPTAPEEAVNFNAESSSFDALAHPQVFDSLTPLPPSMHVEPLINVHKQRRIAGVIKALVAGQHLASRVQFDIEKKLFQRCLRLRGLDAATLQRVLSTFSE